MSITIPILPWHINKNDKCKLLRIVEDVKNKEADNSRIVSTIFIPAHILVSAGLHPLFGEALVGNIAILSANLLTEAKQHLVSYVSRGHSDPETRCELVTCVSGQEEEA